MEILYEQGYVINELLQVNDEYASICGIRRM